MRRKQRTARGLVILLLGLVCALAAQTRQALAAPPRDDVVDVERCRIKFVQRATLASSQVGIVKFVRPAEEGKPVEKGQQVAGLDDDVPQAKVAVARKEIENDIDIRYAKSAAALAKTELKKAEEVNRAVAGTVPDIEVKRLALAADKSVLQIELAEHQNQVKALNLKLAEAELKSYVVTAPFSGIVTQIFKHPGEAVRQGDPILEIVNPERIRAEALVPLTDAWRIKPGDRAQVLLDGPFAKSLGGKPPLFEGKVVFVDVSADPVNHKVRVWTEVKNRNGILRSGLEARLRIFPHTAAASGTGPRGTGQK